MLLVICDAGMETGGGEFCSMGGLMGSCELP